MSSYRLTVEDVFMQIYIVLCNTKGQEAADLFFQTVLNEYSLDNFQKIESILFLVGSIENALKDDGFPSSILFLK